MTAVLTAMFRYRRVCLFFMGAVMLLMLWPLWGLRAEGRLESLLPERHPFIVNHLNYKDELGLGHDVRVAVAVKQGTILKPEYMQALHEINDELFYLTDSVRNSQEDAGAVSRVVVDRAHMKSLLTPNMRWREVTREGFQGGQLAEGYTPDAEGLQRLKANILRSGQMGRLVADDWQSSLIIVPILPVDNLNIVEVSQRLDELRVRYQEKYPDIHIYIDGVPKKMGVLLAGLKSVGVFFIIAVLLTTLVLWRFFSSARLAFTVLLVGVVSVWSLLGIMAIGGFNLDPYSMLLPFLVFAIAISHGIQVTHAYIAALSHESSSIRASQAGLQSVISVGVLGLLIEAVSFLVLLLVPIEAIREMAVAMALSTLFIGLSCFFLLPLCLSLFPAPLNATLLSAHLARKPLKLERYIERIIYSSVARRVLVMAAVFGVVLVMGSLQVRVGDLDAGAPELHPNAQYNQDSHFITTHYAGSSDVFVVLATSAPESCANYATLTVVEQLQRALSSVPGVQSSLSLVDAVKQVQVGFNEGSLKWSSLVADDATLNEAARLVPNLYNSDCSLLPVYVFLTDHRADTLSRVVARINQFTETLAPHSPVHIKMASGNAGIDAAVNDVVASSRWIMLVAVYMVVLMACATIFRSWRAVLCIVLPLVLTSFLCEALMAALGIGIKVATLPVIVLGVGIGVDYAIYLYARYQQQNLRLRSTQAAWQATVRSTGRAVFLTAITLAIAVVTWVFSPIKFQADMGLLLTVMLLWNMVGSLILMPALMGMLFHTSAQDTNT